MASNPLKIALMSAVLTITSPAVDAGEDSTHRWRGSGPAWYETACGLAGFHPESDDPFATVCAPLAPAGNATRNAMSPAALVDCTEPPCTEAMDLTMERPSLSPSPLSGAASTPEKRSNTRF